MRKRTRAVLELDTLTGYLRAWQMVVKLPGNAQTTDVTPKHES